MSITKSESTYRNEFRFSKHAIVLSCILNMTGDTVYSAIGDYHYNSYSGVSTGERLDGNNNRKHFCIGDDGICGTYLGLIEEIIKAENSRSGL